MHRIRRLRELGQSVWLDYLDHHILACGELRRMIQEDGITGVTSNPTIFQKAIASSSDYDARIRSARPSENDARVLEAIMTSDLALACDELRATHEQTDGRDGFASIEVSPAVAEDTAATVEEALRLWNAVDRTNLMVKIPGTRAGLAAIESCLAHGININITLLFSVARYREVMEAWLRALEHRVARGEPVDRVASVASFFVSRVDTNVDKLLDPKSELRGRIAIANAKAAYEIYEHMIASERWKRLAAKGARPQRLLWASTSPKNPAYRDLHYADALVGADTIDTMTRETIKAFLDHGAPEPRLGEGRDRVHEDLAALAKLGIDLERVTDQLEDEGVASFAASYEKAIRSIAEKRRAGVRRQAMKLSDIMQRNVQIVSGDASVREAAQMMSGSDVGALPVRVGDRVTGMITDRDIVVRGIAKGSDLDRTRVAEIMTHEVESVYDDEGIDEAAQRMSDRQIQRLIVMARDGKLVGIVSLGDLARARGVAPTATRALEEIKSPTKASAAGANGAHIER